jgi:hypothetical protein
MNQTNGQGNSCVTPEAPSQVVACKSGEKRVRRPRVTASKIPHAVAELEVPFEGSLIEWRVTAKSGERGMARGLLLPYADQRAYTDRLNSLFTPAGWTRKYALHTSGNFERSRDGKVVAKVFVTCEVTIFGLGSHSATGEEWADDENAGTSAEAQAFKRACCCFGLGRYLYYFSGAWVELDDRNRAKGHPTLAGWATPEGWRQGLRPQPGTESGASPSSEETVVNEKQGERPARSGAEVELIAEIEGMAEPLGRALYRGLLKSVAKVWEPKQISDGEMLRKVRTQMEAAARGLRRLQLAMERSRAEALAEVLHDLQLRSMREVTNLETLHAVVTAIEANADLGSDPA